MKRQLLILFRGERGQIDTNLIHIDKLKLYFGEPFSVSDQIHIECPTIKQIVEFGEQEYYSVVHTLCSTSSDFKSVLWDMGLDWEEISDFDMFIMLAPSLTQDKTKLLLGDVDLSKMKVYPHPENEGEVILADKESGIVIDSYIQAKLSEYIRQMHGLTKNVERAKNKRTKRVMLEYEMPLNEIIYHHNVFVIYTNRNMLQLVFVLFQQHNHKKYYYLLL